MWGAGALLMLLLLGGLILLVAWGIRAVSGSTQPGKSALDTLRRRLAAGEISSEEFDKTKRTLHG